MTLALLIAAVGGAWAQSANPEPIELKPDMETGKKWILADMPAYNIELQVEYYTESNLFLSKDALKDKASIAVTAGELGVQFGEDGKSANPVAEGTAMTVKYNGAKKILGMKVTKNNDALSTALTIEAITAGTIYVKNPKEGMQYSKNGGNKNAVTTDEIALNAGDKVQFYGTATSYNGTQFAGTAEVKVYGNIMSLVSADFATLPEPIALTADNTFAQLFKNYTTLKDASGLLLPATTLTTYCYGSMFMGCSNLTAAPKLPATTLASDCYWRMFKDCTSLKVAYVKAAYVSGPCTSMFYGCSAADATLHTTSDNKASWTGNVPGNWTIDEGWTD